MAAVAAGRASYSHDDPFSRVLLPPSSETEEQRQARLDQEADAKKISDAIDEELRVERERLKVKKRDIKLLLLGQSESGKSTLQKQFQLLYAPATLDSERASWRTVVYYNIASSLRRVIEALDADDDPDAETNAEGSFGSRSRSNSSSGHRELDKADRKSSDEAEKELATLRLRLGPLIAAESTLAARLTGDSGTVAYPPTPSSFASATGPGGAKRGSKVYVRSGWQVNAFKPNVGGRASKFKRLMAGGTTGRQSMDSMGMGEDDRDEVVENVARVLEASIADVEALWGHARVRNLLARRKLRLEESAEFFLNNIERIASPGYMPTTDDILHARVQTMGIVEHSFTVTFDSKPVQWHLYDVGGSRGQRHTWVPFFDDATAIIFLAPVSAFDQYLEEDPRTNRVDDSLQLFTMICSHQLLKKVHLVLFLNKTDVLREKMQRGIRVARYITSYADRPNDYDSVVKYFQAHFLQVHRKNNGDKRLLYTHLTSVVNTKATQAIIHNVRDSVFRSHLQGAALV